ncbi:MAG TPA: GNAT family N-acetyltransferase [Methanocorpusculum sp.]|nr:GNAT family N-acetyltransferase [Methanocorpusculum sp.]
MTTTFIPVQPDDIPALAALAEKIWTEHYTSLIGSAQVSYMLENFQSEQAIQSQLKEGYAYYILLHNRKTAGYFSILPRPKENHLFLSKLYVDKDFRRKGIASDTLIFIQELAKEADLPAVRLTVNKGNTGSIEAYTHLGFKKIDSVVTDIGNGFVMDDYVMEYRI